MLFNGLIDFLFDFYYSGKYRNKLVKYPTKGELQFYLRRYE